MNKYRLPGPRLQHREEWRDAPMTPFEAWYWTHVSLAAFVFLVVVAIVAAVH